MNVFKLVGGTFFAAGVALLAGAGYFYSTQDSFIGTAKSTQGQVIDMARWDSDDSYTYAPIVRFTDDRGQTREFVNPTSSNPPAYAKGEQVRLLYAPNNPGDAIIDDFFGRWGFVMIWGSLGTIFATIGGGLLFWLIRKWQIKQRLRRAGTRISVEFYSVDRDSSITVNGRHPFRVIAQGKNPFSGKLEQFLSEAIWVDPTEELEGTKLQVYIDPNHPDRHSVDVERYLNAG